MRPITPPQVLPAIPRRLLIYAVWDRRGGIDDFIPHALQGLRSESSRILVVVNGALSEEGRAKLEPVADEILVRANTGFDIGAHKHALAHLGRSIDEFDEVVLTNDTWFGPIAPWQPVLERMGARAVHFWGLTDHAEQADHPLTDAGVVLPYHLQSYWIAVRRELFQSPEWEAYWRDLPPLDGYEDAVLKHEAQFTRHFGDLGFAYDAAFRYQDFATENPSLLEAERLVDAGSPALKRRPFFHWPPFLDAHAVIGRWTLEAAATSGYPVELALQNLAKNVPPKVLSADAGLMNVLADSPVSYDPQRPLRVVVIAHIFYDEMTDEMLDRMDTLPVPYDLIVTTPTAERAQRIEVALSRRRPAGSRRTEVRVLPSNDGRDQSAFLIECRDVLLSDDYDLVVKLHSKKTPQDGFNVGRHFKEQQFRNLLDSPGYAANLLGLFQREAGLGLVYPPMIHIGYPTMGRAWWANKPGFEELAADLGIHVPLDDVSPLAPYGSMFVARPEALRILAEHAWRYEEFGGADAYQDGGLAHILERMPSYAAGELGFHTRTVCSFEYMSISHTALEFKLDEMSHTIPGDTVEKIDFLRNSGFVGTGSARDFLRMYRNLRRPAGVERVIAALRPARGLVRGLRRRFRRR
ncbi:rhamnosyltransferase [Microbacterium trichothecenolyticum]|uniref:rhamnan synthesis F family protein n=1 Tax=Microbacterium trichothecenolyticum TaxID=69370 RepID=UPI00285BF780|nr:rhamnan synthesis F family protein [Microbacterium trichothecenolyticum]MDR7185312.1 rhamnosyltransferase [Microbacterium trichothecenolyticum]